MQRRKFIKLSSLIGLLGLTGISQSEISLLESQENKAALEKIKQVRDLSKLRKESISIAYSEKHSPFEVKIFNVNKDSFSNAEMESLNIKSTSLFPFSFSQGDYALQLLPYSKGFVTMNLFKLVDGEKYELVGENIGNTHVFKEIKMLWVHEGIKVVVSEKI